MGDRAPALTWPAVRSVREPRSDKRQSFEILGEGGKDGVILGGVKMVPLK